jgi:hypothetical protein
VFLQCKPSEDLPGRPCDRCIGAGSECVYAPVSATPWSPTTPPRVSDSTSQEWYPTLPLHSTQRGNYFNSLTTFRPSQTHEIELPALTFENYSPWDPPVHEHRIAYHSIYDPSTSLVSNDTPIENYDLDDLLLTPLPRDGCVIPSCVNDHWDLLFIHYIGIGTIHNSTRFRDQMLY